MSQRRISFVRVFRSARTGVVLLSLVSVALSGCVAAIPIIMYEASHKDGQTTGYAVTAQIGKSADEVYQACVTVVNRTPKFKILSEDDTQRTMKIQGEKADGVHHDSLRVTEISRSRCQLVAIAQTPGGQQIDQTTAKNMIRLICDELGVKYKIIKG